MSTLVGTWRSDPTDAPTISCYGDVILNFSPDGVLTYIIRDEGKDSIIVLSYHIEGDVIVTNQPSHSREEHTKFCVGENGVLILLYNESCGRFVAVRETGKREPEKGE
jgi:hypothetical protein